ncbi:PP2C family protein-serine/threonine phosphatase [Streptomyces sp. NPDC001982]|uniref:PP2C family protein-serine/threonine phosphatase n=1 Tax=Streptomyces sp. NPDC001982 TaxID=3154405 RepID=UPI00332134A3
MDLFSRSWAALRSAVAALPDRDFERPSGCTGWLVRDLVCSSMRAIATCYANPGVVLTFANDVPHDGQVTGAGAGHVPLLHAHDDGSHEVHQLPGGPVLGVLPGTDYGEESFALEGDSALVMVTDGVVEGPSLSLDAGLERAGRLAAQALHDGLDAEATADRVLDAAVAVDHLDDVAVLVIRRGDE